MDSKIIIAIDGFASCGKSTLAKALSKILHYAYIDSGAMYRAVTLYFLQQNVDIQDPAAVEDALKHIHIRFKNIHGQNTTFLNGVNVENDIREMLVSDYVSPVSTISAVRRALVKMQKSMGKEKGIVMDGRDIGTVVFQDAELKLFMTADMNIRTERRVKEMQSKNIQNIDFEIVKKNLMERDRIDSTREDSPLRKADDAIEIDNSYLSHDQQLDIALGLAKKAIEMANNSANPA